MNPRASLTRPLARPPRVTQAWADAYPAAFAEEHGLSLVTFDRGLKGRDADVLLLDGD